MVAAMAVAHAAARTIGAGRPGARPGPKVATGGEEHAFTAALRPLIRRDGNHAAVAVENLATGAEASYEGTREFVTASIVKVDILATLLYQLQKDRRRLSPSQRSLATRMIENSDNGCASDLYDEVGGPDDIDEANHVFRLRHTTAGTGGLWGLTTTTASDQLQLLRVVFARHSVLTAASRDYIHGLMGHVETDQRWGVPAAASKGTRFMVKNGWLPSPDTGLWEINSIGEVTRDRQRMLIAVLSDDNVSDASGIAMVEEIARKAARALAR
jgi:beta-lactamase class A